MMPSTLRVVIRSAVIDVERLLRAFENIPAQQQSDLTSEQSAPVELTSCEEEAVGIGHERVEVSSDTKVFAPWQATCCADSSVSHMHGADAGLSSDLIQERRTAGAQTGIIHNGESGMCCAHQLMPAAGAILSMSGRRPLYRPRTPSPATVFRKTSSMPA